MTFNVLNRRIHYWTSFAVAIPLLVIIGTGLLLQTKKHWTWVQPAELRGTGTEPVIGLGDILESLRHSDMAVAGWQDVDRLDIRPDRGIVKALLRSGWEVQVDLGTGAVLQTAYRRSDVIESIHDGSFFGGDWTKLGIFLPSAGALLLMWMGGMWMWGVPVVNKRRVRHRKAEALVADRRRRTDTGLVLLVALALGSVSCGGAPAPTWTPIVGHWTVADEDSGVIVADATRWDGQPLATTDETARALFGEPGADWRENAGAPGAFPVAIASAPASFSRGTLAVDFRLVGGESDQIAGLVFGLQPSGEYFYVRYNTRDDNVALWRYAGGERHRIADGTATRRLPLDEWHTLSVTIDGVSLRAVAAGDLTLVHTLDAPVAGRVGLWTKRDSITAFRSLRVE